MGLTDKDSSGIVDIAIPQIEKTRFRINGDNDKVIWLNTNDTNILKRLDTGYQDLFNLSKDVSELDGVDTDNEEYMKHLTSELDKLDKAMKDKLDYIFDEKISEIILGTNSAYDVKDGKFMFEHIIETLGDLYATSFADEFAKLKKRVNENKHTTKYTKKKS